MKHFRLIALIAIITIGFIACGNGDDETHTHQWQWQVTKAATTEADGVETETCACGATNGTRTINKDTIPFQRDNEEKGLTFGEDDTTYNVKITGNLSNNQVTEIVLAINSAYTAANLSNKAAFMNVFETGSATIIVEVAPDGGTLGYTNWKTTGGGITLYVNAANLANLQTFITAAVANMNTGGTSMGKAIQPTHDKPYTPSVSHLLNDVRHSKKI
jgi:hypothetical protein